MVYNAASSKPGGQTHLDSNRKWKKRAGQHLSATNLLQYMTRRQTTEERVLWSHRTSDNRGIQFTCHLSGEQTWFRREGTREQLHFLPLFVWERSLCVRLSSKHFLSREEIKETGLHFKAMRAREGFFKMSVSVIQEEQSENTEACLLSPFPPMSLVRGGF